jgi:hypothetical protein
MECVPTASNEVVHCAEPPESGSAAHADIAVPLSLKVTVPEGGTPVPVSDAVKVTATPDTDGFRLDRILNVTAVRRVVNVKSPEVALFPTPSRDVTR